MTGARGKEQCQLPFELGGTDLWRLPQRELVAIRHRWRATRGVRWGLEEGGLLISDVGEEVTTGPGRAVVGVMGGQAGKDGACC